MKHIKIIQTEIDVSKILKQLLDNPNDWNAINKNNDIQRNGIHLEKYYNNKWSMQPGMIPITLGVVKNSQDDIYESMLCKNTEFYEKNTEIISWLKNAGYGNHARAAFLKLPARMTWGRHFDPGMYHKNNDRYHLSIQGKYIYEVGGEQIIANPGTLFWFDNKQYHTARNLEDYDRITFSFDIPIIKDVLQ